VLARLDEFSRLSLEVPSVEVDSTSGYRPGIDEIVAALNGG